MLYFFGSLVFPQDLEHSLGQIGIQKIFVEWISEWVVSEYNKSLWNAYAIWISNFICNCAGLQRNMYWNIFY